MSDAYQWSRVRAGLLDGPPPDITGVARLENGACKLRQRVLFSCLTIENQELGSLELDWCKRPFLSTTM